MKKYFSVLILIFLGIQFGLAQYVPPLSDYPNSSSIDEYYSAYSINPSYTGLNKQHEFQYISYNQFVGPTSAYNKKTFAYNGWLDKINSGIGVVANIESFGDLDKKIKINGLYSFNVLKSSDYKLIIGAKFGFERRRISNERFFIDNTVVFGTGNWTNVPTLDLGLSFDYKEFNVGFAYKNLINKNIKFEYSNYEINMSTKGFVLNCSYNFKPSETLKIIPYFSDYFFDKNVISIRLINEYKDKYLFGFGYESLNNKVNGTLAIKLFRFLKLGYLIEKYNNNNYYQGFDLSIIIKPYS